MHQNYLQMYLMQVSKYIPSYAVPTLQQRLEGLSNEEIQALQMQELRDPTMMLIVSLFGGCLGIDRFLLGQMGLGIAKLLTMGFCGIWGIVDLFLIMEETRKYNLNKINEALMFLNR